MNIDAARQLAASRTNRRRGVVLVLVLIAIVFLSLAAYTFANLMIVHRQAAALSGRQTQARALADSGVAATRMLLTYDEVSQQGMGGLWDNADYFRGVLALDAVDYRDRGRFSVLSPVVQEDGSVYAMRYGLEDESARINLNTLIAWDKAYPGSGREMLMQLPGMTEEIADAILDWLDEDDEPREFGAELDDYYAALDPPYAPANGPLQTVEELLKVRGVSPFLLLGADANRNRVLDESELEFSGDAIVDKEGNMLPARGWAGYFTLHGNERNTRPDGMPRIYLNGDDMEQLALALGEVLEPDQVLFIIAYRQLGPFQEQQQQQQSDDATVDVAPSQQQQYEEISVAQAKLEDQLDLTQDARTRIESVLDLIDARIALPDQSGQNNGGQVGNRQAGNTQGGNSQVLVVSPFSKDRADMAEYLPLLLDLVTTDDPEASRAGRININQAPRAVLAGIPGMSDEILENLLARRADGANSDDPTWTQPTWLLTEEVVTLEKMRDLLPLVNAGGDVYRAQVVGFFDDGVASCRIEAVFDATGALPRLVSWRDISHLGRGYDLITLGVGSVTDR